MPSVSALSNTPPVASLPPQSRALSVSDLFGVRNGDQTETEDVTSLRNALETEFNPQDDDVEAPTRTVLDFVNAQFSGGELSDDAVAFLLDVAVREINGVSSFDEANTSTFNAGSTEDAQPATPQSLASVLELARDTFQLIRDSDPPLGLRASILTDTLEGLQAIRTSA